MLCVFKTVLEIDKHSLVLQRELSGSKNALAKIGVQVKALALCDSFLNSEPYRSPRQLQEKCKASTSAIQRSFDTVCCFH
jgi:hypothetical protein